MINKDKDGNMVSVSSIWTRDDILDRAEDLGHGDLPDHVVDNILWSLHSTFNAELGINWTVIDTQIEMELVDYKAGQEDLLKD